MATGKNAVKEVYLNVVNDVIEGVREAFLDEGMDDLVLQELKQVWESKLALCKAVDRAPPPPVKPSVVPPANRVSQVAEAAVRPVPAAQLVHPGITQFHQPSAAVLQPQLVRLQPTHQAAGPGFDNIPQLTAPAQMAANSLPAAFFRQFINYVPGQKQLVLPGLHSATLAPMTAVAANDVGSVVTSKPIVQLDGLGDSSSEEDEDQDDDDDNDDEDDDQNEDADDGNVEEEEPLNSEDDVSDTDPAEVFDAENVVVCQFEKINRCKNRWKFHLKDGIMNLNGRDYLFQKANGDAEW